MRYLIILGLLSHPLQSKLCDTFDNFQVLSNVKKIVNKTQSTLKSSIPRRLHSKLDNAFINIKKRPPKKNPSWCREGIKSKASPKNWSSIGDGKLHDKITNVIKNCLGGSDSIKDITTNSHTLEPRKVQIVGVDRIVQIDIDFGYMTVIRRKDSDKQAYLKSANRMIVDKSGSCKSSVSDQASKRRDAHFKGRTPNKEELRKYYNSASSRATSGFHNFLGSSADMQNLSKFKCL